MFERVAPTFRLLSRHASNARGLCRPELFRHSGRGAERIIQVLAYDRVRRGNFLVPIRPRSEQLKKRGRRLASLSFTGSAGSLDGMLYRLRATAGSWIRAACG